MNIIKPTLPMNGTGNKTFDIQIGASTSRDAQSIKLQVNGTGSNSNLVEELEVIQNGWPLNITNFTKTDTNISFVANGKYVWISGPDENRANAGEGDTSILWQTNTGINTPSSNVFGAQLTWTSDMETADEQGEYDVYFGEYAVSIGDYVYYVYTSDTAPDNLGNPTSDYKRVDFVHTVKPYFGMSDPFTYEDVENNGAISLDQTIDDAVLSYTANGTPTVISEPDWVTFDFDMGVISATSNSSTSSRSGQVIIGLEEAPSYRFVVNISQAGSSEYINISPSSASIPAEGKSQVFTVSTNASSWSVSSKPSWVTTSISGNKITATISSTSSARSGSITVKSSGNKTASATISQSAAITFTVSPTSYTISADGMDSGEIIATITTTASGVTLSKDTFNRGTIQLVAAGSGKWNLVNRSDIAANTSGSEITGVVTVYPTGDQSKAVSIIIKQLAASSVNYYYTMAAWQLNVNPTLSSNWNNGSYRIGLVFRNGSAKQVWWSNTTSGSSQSVQFTKYVWMSTSNTWHFDGWIAALPTGGNIDISNTTQIHVTSPSGDEQYFIQYPVTDAYHTNSLTDLSFNAYNMFNTPQAAIEIDGTLSNVNYTRFSTTGAWNITLY